MHLLSSFGSIFVFVAFSLISPPENLQKEEKEKKIQQKVARIQKQQQQQ